MEFWRLIGPGHGYGLPLAGSLDPMLVALSWLAAALAAFTSLAVIDRVVNWDHGPIRRTWMVAGSVAMGTGIWAMHFIGMLAYTWPVGMSLSAPVTLASGLPAVLGSGAAIHAMSRDRVSVGRLQLGGLMMALGIGTMHYFGMEAVRLGAVLRYDYRWFILSIVVAHILATVAIWIKFALPGRAAGGRIGTRVASAAVMGAAVAGMHYTAMAATRFFPSDQIATSTMILPRTILSVFILGAVVLIAGIAVIGAIVDARLREAHQSVQASERFAKLLLDAAADGVYGTDLDGRATFANPAFIRMTGYRPEELIGQRIGSVVHRHEDGRPYSTKEWPASAALREGTNPVGVAEHLLWRKDGSPVPVEMTSTPVCEAGEIIGAVVTIRDVTDRQKLHRELNRAQKLEAIGQLAGGIAHEINTPTQYVSSNTRFVAESLAGLSPFLRECQKLLESPDLQGLPPGFREAAAGLDLGFIMEEVPGAIRESLEGLEAVSEIVKAMKAFSEVGGQKLSRVALNELLGNTMIVCRNEWRNLAEIDTDFEEHLPPVLGTARDLSQVFLGILVNAAQAIERRAGLASQTKGRISVATNHATGYAVIRISDNGDGIAQEHIDRVFDPFFTTKAVGAGTGQSLAIAHSLVTEGHRGTISVESRRGVGTTFTITLPLATDGKPADAEPVNAPIMQGAMT